MKTTTIQRNRDFINVCKQVIDEERGGNWPLTARRVALLAMYRPARSFYTDYTTTYNHLSERAAIRDRGGEIADPVTAPQWRLHDIENLVEKLRADKHLRRSEALTLAIAMPAPRFYINEQAAVSLVRQHFGKEL